VRCLGIGADDDDRVLQGSARAAHFLRQLIHARERDRRLVDRVLALRADHDRDLVRPLGCLSASAVGRLICNSVYFEYVVVIIRKIRITSITSIIGPG
jgi:hypothetical protein